MRLSRALSALLPSSSSQAGKWFLLRTSTILQAATLSTAATANPASRRSTRTVRDPHLGAETPTQPDPPEEGKPGGSPPQAPAKVEEGAASRLLKPSEIPWQAKVANSVHLIGRLGSPIVLDASPDGVYTAVSVVFHEKAHDLPQFWIPIVFQGDLAQIAACNLREKDHVYVTGQLTGGSQLIDRDAETKMQVMVDSISYVLELDPEKKRLTNRKGLGGTSAEVKDASSIMQFWNDLFANPDKWWDYRKGNKKSGKFEHMDTGQLLEINESTPEWVLSKLDTFVFSSNTSSVDSRSANAKKSGESMEGYWSDLLTNPDHWWDNREDKLNGKFSPKGPDFSNKVTRQGLWLNSAPDWVLPKLKSTAVRAKAYWQNAAKKISTGLTKKGETNVTGRLCTGLTKKAEVKDASSIMQFWNDLFANPDKWWDYRKGNKKSGKFEHKDTGQLLEINESTPEWVLSKLDTFVFSSSTSSVDSRSANAKKSGESVKGYWSDLLTNPDQWWDNREDKLNGKSSPKRPDFSNKVTRQGLWLNSAPDWVLPKLKSTAVRAEACCQNAAKKISTGQTKKGETNVTGRLSTGLTKKEESWKNLMENPDKWWDKRSNKSKPNAPDFKHKETGEALWLHSTTTPNWVLDKYSPMKAENR